MEDSSPREHPLSLLLAGQIFVLLSFVVPEQLVSVLSRH